MNDLRKVVASDFAFVEARRIHVGMALSCIAVVHSSLAESDHDHHSSLVELVI